MEYAADEGRDWRREIQGWLERELGCTVFNPNVESEKFRGRGRRRRFPRLKKRDIARYASIVERLVAIDCDEIAAGRILLSCTGTNPRSAGAGTKGELTMAHHFKKPVYMVDGRSAR